MAQWIEVCLSIGEAANCIGVAVSTLRRWESEGKCCADFRTHGRHRRYSLTRLQTQIRNHQQETSTPLQEKTIGYARVSSSDQKEDLIL